MTPSLWRSGLVALAACCIYPVFAQTTDWATPSEASDYRRTPRYAETMAYIRRIAAAAPNQVKVEPFGTTGEGRVLYQVIVSKDGQFTPAAARAHRRAVVLIQNGIHAGEIDGKDASLALLREMVITHSLVRLLDNAVVVIIPVYNIDGHEQMSPYNRLNQNGPEEKGWRTTTTNLNLNRDYLKADAPETRAFLKLWNQWLPDFFIDNHVTDGADYRYDTTYAIDSGPDVNPPLVKWLEEKAFPSIDASVTKSGHVIGPFIFQVDNMDPAKGLTVQQTLPSFSTGYMVLQNRPGMVVEMHMLKDYKTRVTGNYDIMRAALEVINRDADALRQLNAAADAATIAAGRNGGRVALTVTATGETEPFTYKGYQFKLSDSAISGAKRIEYSREPLDLVVPKQTTLKIARAATMPAAYIVPPQWTRVIDVLRAHGLELLTTTQPYQREVEIYRCPPPHFSARSSEGRHRVSFGKPGDDTPACTLEKRSMLYPVGSIVVPMAQRAAKVAVQFLEPQGPDSAISWGFFDAIFEQKEYGESYAIEKFAPEMLAKDPQLKAEFERLLASDKAFAADPEARLNFFYQRSPWREERLGLYPVGRLSSLKELTLATATK